MKYFINFSSFRPEVWLDNLNSVDWAVQLQTNHFILPKNVEGTR